MYFQHIDDIWRDFPQLVPGVLFAEGISTGVDVGPRIEGFVGIAEQRLGTATEAELPEIQAWRRTFTRMGLKPTRYRCAAEALLRRFRKEGQLPRIHPLIDLCNAVSLAYAIPIAALDVSQVSNGVEVRYATGQEQYQTFAGEVERPEAGEVIFADPAGRAHARRWTNRQSAASAVRDTTTGVLIVAEAMHDSAPDDVRRLVATIAEELRSHWSATPTTALLTQHEPRFEF